MITADTNLLIRLVMADDEAQSRLAVRAVEEASVVAIGVHTLCEFVWVLSRSYAVPRGDVAHAIRQLIETRNVVVHRPAVEAGLEMLEAGGDFADGAIAFEGRLLGGETFVSFDGKAVARLKRLGHSARELG
ncbi:putative nucleic-acid-binding protein [Methylobacterium aerolatum]|uniref:Nucleic-acid-binding protein n=2 Tax=Methylobacterium aerolatum TaxID=418708 RepID=A0ABU0HXV4_9HYPH|nr:putative nucleic-acid-binding protein [Methylobacterium aerolatum]GJD37050.1 hypothetical protein FMGBMHLM_3976 [Methylobacterium aerolatum]